MYGNGKNGAIWIRTRDHRLSAWVSLPPGYVNDGFGNITMCNNVHINKYEAGHYSLVKLNEILFRKYCLDLCGISMLIKIGVL